MTLSLSVVKVSFMIARFFKRRWVQLLISLGLAAANSKYNLGIPPEMIGIPTSVYIAGKTITDIYESKSK
jgi:hypothetical protein